MALNPDLLLVTKMFKSTKLRQGNVFLIQSDLIKRADVECVAITNEALTGLPTIDGVSPLATERVLLTGQTDEDENGPWEVAAGSWVRPTTFDADAEVFEGLYVLSLAGTIRADKTYILTTLTGSFGSFTAMTWTDAITNSIATIGRIKNTNIAFFPLESEADTTGRTSLMGYNVVATAIMTQTDEQVDIAAVAEFGSPSIGSDDENGYTLFFSNVPLTLQAAFDQWSAALNGTVPADALDGLALVNSIIVPSPTIDFSGEESQVSLVIKGIIPAAELGTMCDYGLMTFDA